MLARSVCAGQSFSLASRSVVPLGTGASQFPSVIANASPSVEARSDGAGVQRLLAVRAGVVRRTDAGVAALSGVVAGPLVLARLVIGAVVEVLVTEETAPAFLAVAVPGPAAGPVHAARVPLALVAQLAHPARMTAERKLTVSRVITSN